MSGCKAVKAGNFRPRFEFKFQVRRRKEREPTEAGLLVQGAEMGLRRARRMGSAEPRGECSVINYIELQWRDLHRNHSRSG